MKGIIFDIKRYSLHDGPGLRTTIFFKGCPLRCLWCHNPESQNLKPQIVWYENKCMGCLDCYNSCIERAIDITNGISIIKNRCTLCYECIKICPTGALKLIGKEYEEKRLLKEILKEEPFFEDGGGVTISGGEPFVQYNFLIELLKLLKKEQLHIALDTTGYVETDKLLESARYVSLFLYDLKIMNPEQHKKYTGVDNTLILNNLLALDDNNAKIAIRIPIIPTINDDKKNLTSTLEFLSKLKNIETIDLLPFHNMMMDKYRRLKSPFLLKNIKKPSKERMEELSTFFKSHGFKVNVGG